MGGAIGDLAQGVGDFAKKAYGGAYLGNAVGGIAKGIGGAIGSNDLSKFGEKISDTGNSLWGSSSDPANPTAPGVDPAVKAAMEAQQKQAKEFRANLGQNEQNAYQNMAQGANQKMGQDLHNVDVHNNARGMLYGGINEGNKQGVRAQEQQGLAQGRANINQAYGDAANQMDAAAIGTGVAVQQTQQSVQDKIYQQAMQNYMQQNAAMGNLFQGVATIGGMAAFGPAGGMAAGAAAGAMK